jgi:two-component system, sensor histidine kinase
MKKRPIIIYVILLGLVLSLVAAAVVFSTHWILRAGMDKLMTGSYGDHLDDITEQFAVQEARLQETGMPQAYEQQFKESAILQLSQKYYHPGSDLPIYITDFQGSVIAHPELPAGTNLAAELVEFPDILKRKNGEMEIMDDGVRQWLIFRTYEKWDWIVMYSMPTAQKYAAVYRLDFQLAAVMLAILLVTLVLVALWLHRVVVLPIRDSEQRFRSIVEHLNDALYIHDFDGNLLDVNDNTCKLLGYTREELIGSHLSRFDGPENTRLIPERMKALVETGQLFFDGEHIRKDGTLVPTTVSARVVSREGRGLAHSFLRDITERRKAEDQIARSMSLLKATLESTADGILVIDAQGKVVNANQRFSQLWNIPQDLMAAGDDSKLLGHVLGQLEDPDEFLRKVKELYASPESESLDTIRFGDGRVFERYSKPQWLNEKPEGRVWSLRDITARQKAEDDLRNAVHAANAASVAKSQFLANMSHEIRTPMNAILGFSELLCNEPLTGEQADFVGTIRTSGTHLLALINDILDFSKIEAGKMTLEITECSLAELLNEIESLMTPFAKTRGLRFEMLEPTVLPQTIRTDPVRLRQCLTNLINNAVKFTESGHVLVRTTLTESADAPFLRFEVEDTGPGIAPEAQERIFEAFEQADGSMTRKYGGTGLGLTITRRLTEMLGGKLTLVSELSKGSVFAIEIPANIDIQNQTAQNRRNFPTPGESSDPLPQRFQGTVLVAEDIRTNQALIRTLLQQLGLSTTIVSDGQAAVEKALEISFDLIILDMQMPRLNGFDAARFLRNQRVNTPIIAVTAGAIVGDREKCLAAGCDHYLSKPISRQGLVAVLAQVLPAAAPADQTT